MLKALAHDNKQDWGVYLDELSAVLLQDYNAGCEAHYTQGVMRGISRLKDTDDLQRQIHALTAGAAAQNAFEAELLADSAWMNELGPLCASSS
tara:strand:+ start:204 stop:482 length:279 start_codon:yes stop_codon:yes gene_type:complete